MGLQDTSSYQKVITSGTSSFQVTEQQSFTADGNRKKEQDQILNTSKNSFRPICSNLLMLPSQNL